MFLVDFRQDVSALLYPGKKLLLDELLEFLLAASNDLAQLAVFLQRLGRLPGRKSCKFRALMPGTPIPEVAAG